MENKIPEKFHDRRAEGETVLRQAQLVQLHLLYVLDAICREHKITYFLMFGTLLGALRHDGYIPWDDDLDVAMPRKDYEKFLKIAKEALPADVMLQTHRDTPHTAIPFSKMRDKSSFFFERRPDINTMDSFGLWLDVFAFDEVPARMKNIRNVLIKVYASAWHRAIWFSRLSGLSFLRGVICPWLALGCRVVSALTRLVLHIWTALSQKRVYMAMLECGSVKEYPKEVLFPAKEHIFEDGMFPVPAQPETVLTTDFGNWREIPPPEKRPRHARIIDPFQSADCKK